MEKVRFLNTNKHFYYKKLDFRNYYLNISAKSKLIVLIKYYCMYLRILLGYKKHPKWLFYKY